ncbi:LPAR4 protein, partial [Amia calva]|nr:LPAR4 protein [Amia calva]
MVVPIYIINLLISDLLQIIVRPVFIFFNFNPEFRYVDLTGNAMAVGSQITFLGCLCASVWFMVCIALERYLVVAHPLWYRFRRTVRHTVVISVGVWVMTLIFIAICILSLKWYVFMNALMLLFLILLLLPFPLLVFFFVGTWRAITGATSVRDAEKRRILGTLALVLGSYTVLFLPYCIVFICKFYKYFIPNTRIPYFVTEQMIKLNALVDPVLYILLRPDVRDTLGSVPCCQKLFTLTSCWTPRAEQQETEDAAAECPTESSV